MKRILAKEQSPASPTTRVASTYRVKTGNDQERGWKSWIGWKGIAKRYETFKLMSQFEVPA